MNKDTTVSTIFGIQKQMVDSCCDRACWVLNKQDIMIMDQSINSLVCTGVGAPHDNYFDAGTSCLLLLRPLYGSRRCMR
jgi:hypothetical protein